MRPDALSPATRTAVQSFLRLVRGGILADALDLRSAPFGKPFSAQAVSNTTFPPLLLETLSKATVSLPPTHPLILSMSFNQYGFEQLASWRARFASSNVPKLELSIVEQFAGPYMRESIIRQLKQQQSSVAHDQICVLTTSFATHRQALGITNRAACYVFLLDGPHVVYKSSGSFDPVSDAELLKMVVP